MSLVKGPSAAGVRLLTMRGGLVLGFGVLLILLILSGLSALHALAEVQNANQTSLGQFLAKNQQLDEIRAAVYLSGTYLRDYLLEPDRTKAEQSRGELIDAKARIQTLLTDNALLADGDDREMFERQGLNVARQPDNGARPRPDNRTGWLEGDTPDVIEDYLEGDGELRLHLWDPSTQLRYRAKRAGGGAGERAAARGANAAREREPAK